MNPFSSNKNLAYALVTLLCLLFIGASYFFVYMPANEKAVEAQRFRTLQNIVGNVTTKISNSKSLLKIMLDSSSNVLHKKNIAEKTDNGYFTIIRQDIDAKEINDSTDTTYNVRISSGQQQLALSIIHKDESGKGINNNSFKLSVIYTFEQLIRNLLPANVFDEYIVFNDGVAIYETFPSGIYDAKKDSLIKAKNGIGGSSVINVTLSGKDYKMFLQPLSLGKDNKFVIGGLLSSSRFQQEKAQLPTQAIMLLVILVLSMIVIFPWIKLYQMGNKDRLTIGDGLSSVVVSLLLMSLLFFCFFKYNAYLRPNINPDSIGQLSLKMSTAFKAEIDSSYEVLSGLNKLKINGRIGEDIKNLDKDTIKYSLAGKILQNEDSVLLDSVKLLAKKANIDQVFWLDATGFERTNWITTSENPNHGDYSGRAYFSRIQNNTGYYLNNDPKKQFYLQQIVSWTNGGFTSAMSIPTNSSDTSQKAKVAAMTFTVKCLTNVVLPPGYLYAVIDAGGKVLYHSLASKNLNENLLTEFSANDRLMGYLQAHTSGSFETQYFSKDYLAQVTPVSELPYSFVLMEDKAFNETRDIEVYSFTFSMLVLFFLFLMLLLSVTFIVSSRRSFFKKQLFDTSWIGPKTSFNKEYAFSAVFNTLIVLLLCIFFTISSFLVYIYILLFSVSFSVLFLNRLIARRYLQQDKRNNLMLKRIAKIWLYILIFIINCSALYTLDTGNAGMFIFYQFLAVILAALLYRYCTYLQPLGKRLQKSVAKKWNYTHNYCLMALTRLIITSGIPVAFFYVTAFNFEQNIGIRYKMLSYSDTLVKKYPDIKERLSDSANYPLSKLAIYTDGAWINNDPKLVSAPLSRDSNYPSREDSITLALLHLFRLPVTENAIANDRFYNTQPSDTSILFNPLCTNARECAGVSMTRQLNADSAFLQMNSSGLNYHMPRMFSKNIIDKGVLFWLMLLLVLVIFFFVIHNIIKKLFALNLPDLRVWKTLDDKIILNTHLNKLLFIIGLPGAGKLNSIMEKVKCGKIFYEKEGDLIYDKNDTYYNNVFVADLINIPDATENVSTDKSWNALLRKVFDKKYRLIIVNHFEYNIQDEVTNRIKLNFLEKLMLDDKCKIIILSSVHPVAFLDSVNYDSFKAKDAAMPAHDLERWHVLLGHYRIAIIPLPVWETPADNSSWKQLICNETKYTHFLHSMQNATLEIAEDLQGKNHNKTEVTYNEQAVAETDELAFKLQVTAHYFYMYIWQSLTKEEKYLLYDLAEDNLVNSYDDYNLSLLIGKGLLRHDDGSLEIFNKGFRNFILTAIGNVEAMKIQNQIKDNGNWSKLRIPMIIIILAILAFLLISQQEAYSTLITYVAALSAGVPTVLKLFSLFDKKAQKPA